MDLVLAEHGQGLANNNNNDHELALDFLPGLVCTAAYACGAPGVPSGQGKEKHAQSKDKGPSNRRAGNVKLAPVPSPELLAALADLTKHMQRFHVSQVNEWMDGSGRRDYTHNRIHCPLTHAHLYNTTTLYSLINSLTDLRLPIQPDQPSDPRPRQEAILPSRLLTSRQHARCLISILFFWLFFILCP